MNNVSDEIVGKLEIHLFLFVELVHNRVSPAGISRDIYRGLVTELWRMYKSCLETTKQ
jgi:hypothetical protein